MRKQLWVRHLYITLAGALGKTRDPVSLRPEKNGQAFLLTEDCSEDGVTRCL